MLVDKVLLLCVIPMVYSYGLDHWNDPNPVVFNIGGVLSGNRSKDFFKETIAVSKYKY